MLINMYYSVAKLEAMLQQAKENGKGLSTTISVNSELDKFEQNVSQFLQQTQEERESKTPRVFFANGKVIYSKAMEIYPPAPKKDFDPSNAPKSTQTKSEKEFLNEDLPF